MESQHKVCYSPSLIGESRRNQSSIWIVPGWHHCFGFLSALWQCEFSDMKGIWPVKTFHNYPKVHFRGPGQTLSSLSPEKKARCTKTGCRCVCVLVTCHSVLGVILRIANDSDCSFWSGAFGHVRMCFQGVGRSKHSGRGAKVLSTKVTGRPDARRSASLPSSTPTLVPPMTSVVVERHQPISKVTCLCTALPHLMLKR